MRKGLATAIGPVPDGAAFTAGHAAVGGARVG